MKPSRNKRAAKKWQPKKKSKFALKLDFRRNRDPISGRRPVGKRAAFSLRASLARLFRKDKNKRRRPISKRAVIVLSGILATFALLYAALFSDMMRIKIISSSGNENIAAAEMEAVVRNEMAGKISRIFPKDNYLFVDEAGIKKKLSETFSEMENVEVAKKFPHEITLTVKEKQTALIWCRDRCYFVSEKGAAFLQTDEGELIKQQKHFIKIIEEAQIAEETEAQRRAMQEAAGADVAGAAAASAQEGGDDVSDAQNIEAAAQQVSSALPAVTPGERVADEEFIAFAVKISGLTAHNQKVKIKYFKTKGYSTRELIGFTDKNTRLYLDTTKSAEKQAKNLDYLLGEAIDKAKIDTLQYIYLKNEDRVFYK